MKKRNYVYTEHGKCFVRLKTKTNQKIIKNIKINNEMSGQYLVSFTCVCVCVFLEIRWIMKTMDAGEEEENQMYTSTTYVTKKGIPIN